jgi:osmotically inducible protein OsmC
MQTRKAEAEWHGDLKDGEGTIKLGNGRFKEPYSATSRFGDGKGTNPEELIAAAQAACYSMALAHTLAEGGHAPKRVHTEAAVKLEKRDSGFTITTIPLKTEAEVPDVEDEAFQEFAEHAKETCPVSNALENCDIQLEATLR